MNSLRRRLNRVLLILLGGLVLQWFVADRTIVYAGEREMQTRLRHDADSLASTFVTGANGQLQIDPRSAGTIYAHAYSGHYFVVKVGGQRINSSSFGQAQAFEPAPGAADSLAHVAGPRGQPLLVLTTHIDVAGQPVALAVGEDLTELRGERQGFRLVFFALSLGILAGAVALQGRELRWALKPLDTVRESVLQMCKGGKPVAAVDAPEEVRPLVDEIVRLLAFVEQRLQLSRTAVGNLSHALKTPLAAVFRLIDDPRMDANGDIRESIRTQAAAIHTCIERQLNRARLAGAGHAHQRFDAAAEMPAVVELLRRIHRDKALSIEWTASPGPLAFDRQDMLELVGNLADNACKWAAGTVKIEFRRCGGLDIVVSDDGPGCSEQSLAWLGTRGRREDESVPGHGLGLAIARDIVEFAGGQLLFSRSATLGGLEVRAHFPQQGQAAPAAPAV